MGGLGIILFILMILGAIGLHEFGHFATAKKFGIKVERFFIGFGPRIWSVKRGETEYGIAAIPAGGYVRIAGMNPFEEIAPEDVPRTFKAKPAWQRAIVLAAGSTMHFILAYVILVALLFVSGYPETTTIVERVTPTTATFVSPAAEAGIMAGDEIEEIDGRPIDNWDALRSYVASRPGAEVRVVVLRNGARLTMSARLAESTPPPETPPGTPEPMPVKVGFLGVGPKVITVKPSLLSSIGLSGSQLGSGMWQSLQAFGRIFTPGTFGRLFGQIAGDRPRSTNDPISIVGVTRVAGEAASRGEFAFLMYLFVGFNVFIGVANLIPLPPLDGGHLAVLAYEKLFRRDVDMRKLLPVTAFVISIFVALFVMLLYLDILNPVPAVGG